MAVSESTWVTTSCGAKVAASVFYFRTFFFIYFGGISVMETVRV